MGRYQRRCRSIMQEMIHYLRISDEFIFPLLGGSNIDLGVHASVLRVYIHVVVF